jgi:Kef-type K+ transport system membrane component KefB
MATPVLLIELGAVIVGLAILARLAGRFGFSSIPLFLVAGLAFGEGGILPLVTSEAFIEVGAEIGLILLLLVAFSLWQGASASLRTAQVLRRPKPLVYLQGLKWMAQAKERVR